MIVSLKRKTWRRVGIMSSIDFKIKYILIGTVLKEKFNFSNKANQMRMWKRLPKLEKMASFGPNHGTSKRTSKRFW